MMRTIVALCACVRHVSVGWGLRAGAGGEGSPKDWFPRRIAHNVLSPPETASLGPQRWCCETCSAAGGSSRLQRRAAGTGFGVRFKHIPMVNLKLTILDTLLSGRFLVLFVSVLFVSVLFVSRKEPGNLGMSGF